MVVWVKSDLSTSKGPTMHILIRLFYWYCNNTILLTAPRLVWLFNWGTKSILNLVTSWIDIFLGDQISFVVQHDVVKVQITIPPGSNSTIWQLSLLSVGEKRISMLTPVSNTDYSYTIWRMRIIDWSKRLQNIFYLKRVFLKF